MTTYKRAGTVYIDGIDFDVVKGWAIGTNTQNLSVSRQIDYLNEIKSVADEAVTIDALLDKVEIGKNLVSVTMPQESYKDKNNIVLYVNGKYVAQSWHGKRYYSFAPSHAGGKAGFVAILALKKGDVVEVDLRDGRPGANGKKIRALAKITVTDEMLAGNDIRLSSVESGEKKGHYPYT